MVSVVGADLGNDSLKIVFGQRHQFKLKNAVSKRMREEVRKDLSVDRAKDSSITEDLDVLIESETVQGRFFVGPLAVRNGEEEILTGTAKANNPFIVVPLITMLALDIKKPEREREFKLVCGLPISEFTVDREKFASMIKGTYKVCFLSSIYQHEVVVKITDVTVLPEGVAVIMNQLLNDDATGFRNPSLRQGHVGVIDIGAFTTDIPVIVNGKPDSDASTGINEGIAHYLDRIVAYVNHTHHVLMTRAQLVERLEKNDLSMHIKGSPVDLTGAVNEQLMIFANKIVSIVDNLWSKHYEIQDFFVVGGGAKALRNMLIEEMKKRNITLTFVDQHEDPQMQNALGYWKFAQQKFGG